MITRKALRELASFEAAEESAISFYFQSSSPRDKAHRDDAILIKDMVREARNRNRLLTKETRADLDRIAGIAEKLIGDHTRAKAIFACAEANIWREFDLPRLPETELLVNRRFHLSPLAALVDESPRSCVALIDRKRARTFSFWMGEVAQWDDLTDEMPRSGRSDGFHGYDAGHVERHVENFALRHYQNVADHVLKRYANGDGFDKLLIGCRDELWAEIESQLHPYLKQILLGRFSLDVATATLEQVSETAERFLSEDLANRRQALLREVLGEAKRNGRGAVGLRQVMSSLERGEVQTMLLGDKLTATVTQCTNCGHLDTRAVKECAVCAHPTREVDDVADALANHALRNNADVVYITGDPDLDRVGNVGALLRFRADQNTSEKQMAS
jgi:peptide subunit release factor 1 (eRF1)